MITAPATSLTLDPSTTTAGPGVKVGIDATFVLPRGNALHEVRMTVDSDRLPAGWSASGPEVRPARSARARRSTAAGR